MEADSDGFALMENESDELEMDSNRQYSDSVHRVTVEDNFRNRNITTLKADRVFDVPK
jgi:hypothetical protein